MCDSSFTFMEIDSKLVTQLCGKKLESIEKKKKELKEKVWEEIQNKVAEVNKQHKLNQKHWFWKYFSQNTKELNPDKEETLSALAANRKSPIFHRHYDVYLKEEFFAEIDFPRNRAPWIYTYEYQIKLCHKLLNMCNVADKIHINIEDYNKII